jgi:hypothetical protein
MKMAVTFHHTVKKDSRCPVPRKTAILFYSAGLQSGVDRHQNKPLSEFALTRTKLLASVLQVLTLDIYYLLQWAQQNPDRCKNTYSITPFESEHFFS